MINKEVKIVGGVNRTNPIDLKTMDNEVAALAGRSPKAPIDMLSLWNEIQELKGSVGNLRVIGVGTISLTTKNVNVGKNNGVVVCGRWYFVNTKEEVRENGLRISGYIKNGSSGSVNGNVSVIVSGETVTITVSKAGADGNAFTLYETYIIVS